MSTLLAFDVGLKRTGVAVGSTLADTASTLKTLNMRHGRTDVDEITALITEWQPETIVIGSTHNSSGELNKARNHLRHYCQQQKRKVVMIDETLSTETANQLLSERQVSLQRKQELRDQVAAQLILQTYLHSL